MYNINVLILLLKPGFFHYLHPFRLGGLRLYQVQILYIQKGADTRRRKNIITNVETLNKVPCVLFIGNEKTILLYEEAVRNLTDIYHGVIGSLQSGIPAGLSTQ